MPCSSCPKGVSFCSAEKGGGKDGASPVSVEAPAADDGSVEGTSAAVAPGSIGVTVSERSCSEAEPFELSVSSAGPATAPALAAPGAEAARSDVDADAASASCRLRWPPPRVPRFVLRQLCRTTPLASTQPMRLLFIWIFVAPGGGTNSAPPVPCYTHLCALRTDRETIADRHSSNRVNHEREHEQCNSRQMLCRRSRQPQQGAPWY